METAVMGLYRVQGLGSRFCVYHYALGRSSTSIWTMGRQVDDITGAYFIMLVLGLGLGLLVTSEWCNLLVRLVAAQA